MSAPKLVNRQRAIADITLHLHTMTDVDLILLMVRLNDAHKPKRLELPGHDPRLLTTRGPEVGL